MLARANCDLACCDNASVADPGQGARGVVRKPFSARPRAGGERGLRQDGVRECFSRRMQYCGPILRSEALVIGNHAGSATEVSRAAVPIEGLRLAANTIPDERSGILRRGASLANGLLGSAEQHGVATAPGDQTRTPGKPLQPTPPRRISGRLTALGWRRCPTSQYGRSGDGNAMANTPGRPTATTARACVAGEYRTSTGAAAS